VAEPRLQPTGSNPTTSTLAYAIDSAASLADVGCVWETSA